MSWLSAKFTRVVLLPLLLSATTVLVLGSFFETSDDQTLAWLFSGALATGPVPSLPLYLHGYGHLLAAAYAVAPAVPWLGLLLSGLLLGATVLTFAVLDWLLRPLLRPAVLVVVLGVFFSLAWVEHWLWFSHGRVALLLAGAGVLFAAQRPAQRGALVLGLVALGLAWLVRPSLAVLGAGAVVPAARLLAGGWRRAAPILAGAALVLVVASIALQWQLTPTEARTQQRDAYFARILDYNQLLPQPRTSADSLGTAAIGMWLLGDSTVVNADLCRRAYRFDAADFLRHEVPAKLRLRLGLLVRDYFPLLLAVVVTALVVARQRGFRGWFWLVQLGFAGALLLLAGLLKLPPRLALPLLDFWLLTNVIFWLEKRRSVPAAAALCARDGKEAPPTPPLARGLGLAAGALVIGLYGAKTWHRHQVLRREQHQHQLGLSQIDHLGRGRLRVLAGTNDLLKSLSPFRSYRSAPGPVLLLTGWSAHDASQSRLRRALSGSADQTACLRRLARLPGYGPGARVLWVLTPETANWLSRRFRLHGPRLMLSPELGQPAIRADSTLHVYHLQGCSSH
ncbi:hypothetical protein [Hymenobacter rubidus]|uniref:hypothetical protein n=1 Tax=Hymenobacter rubidus TaxID=1441626 RepID=UPI00191D40AA|nr:hypothetical protein [Hymenobacter rubidus]